MKTASVLLGSLFLSVCSCLARPRSPNGLWREGRKLTELGGDERPEASGQREEGSQRGRAASPKPPSPHHTHTLASRGGRGQLAAREQGKDQRQDVRQGC